MIKNYFQNSHTLLRAGGGQTGWVGDGLHDSSREGRVGEGPSLSRQRDLFDPSKPLWTSPTGGHHQDQLHILLVEENCTEPQTWGPTFVKPALGEVRSSDLSIKAKAKTILKTNV